MNTSIARLAPDAPWVVIKFGGTSVSTRTRWDTIAEIAASHCANGKRVLIVVSALSGVTDLLKRLGETRDDFAQARQLRDTLVARHHALFDEMGLPKRNAIDAWMARLDQLLEDPRHSEARLSWQAELLALGELCSSTLGARYLNESRLDTLWLDARDFLRAEALPNQSEWGQWLSASVRFGHAPEIAAGLASRGDVFITQGFIARKDAADTASSMYPAG